MKRKSSVYYPLENKVRSQSSIEKLSNEIFYEICDYLNPWDIYNAFSNLNDRFEQLLDNSSMLYKIKLTDRRISNEVSMNIWRSIMYLNRKQIFSMQLFMSSDIDRFLLSFLLNSSFHRLQSLVLIQPKPDTLVFILRKLIDLPRLSSLTIKDLDDVKDLTEIYRIILTLPMLRYYRMSVSRWDLCISLPMATDERSSPLEYLIIDHEYTFKELSTILSYTPQLRHLSFNESCIIDRTDEIISLFIPTNLTYLRLQVQYIKFDEFESFIRRIHPKLKVLLFIISTGEIDYYDAHRWEQLIVQYLPQLEIFSLEYCEILDDTTESNVYFEGSNPFLSSFWLKRQWMFEIEIQRGIVIYSIRPSKKRWYEQPNVDKSIRLSLSCIPPIEANEDLLADFSRVLSVTQVRHLEIFQEQISVDVLMEIIDLLPQLTTIKLHSLSSDQLRDSETNELIVIPPTKSMNKITKVYLKRVCAIEEIYLLMNMCPCMSYLKIDSFHNVTMDVLVRDILKKINRNSNQHLRTLCFRASTTDDSMMKILENMKNDYAINWVDGYIVLQWK